MLTLFCYLYNQLGRRFKWEWKFDVPMILTFELLLWYVVLSCVGASVLIYKIGEWLG